MAKQKIKTVTYKLPAHWGSALINDDRSGMEESEIEEMNNWLNKVKPGYCTMPEGEPYFSRRNDANNLGGDVWDFVFIKNIPSLPIVFDNPETAIKLTEEEAKLLGIDITKDEIKGNLKTYGMWDIAVSYKALCMSGKLGMPEGCYTERFIQKTFYGIRTMTNINNKGGYELEGWASVDGKKYSAFTSTQMFEVNGKLIDVAVIHARVK